MKTTWWNEKPVKYLSTRELKHLSDLCDLSWNRVFGAFFCNVIFDCYDRFGRDFGHFNVAVVSDDCFFDSARLFETHGQTVVQFFRFGPSGSFLFGRTRWSSFLLIQT